MANAPEIASRYGALWNETDPERRRDLVARSWSEDASDVDPRMRGDSHDGIDALIAAFTSSFPGHRLVTTGEPDGHNDRARSAPPVAHGIDFAILTVDGRLQSVTSFLDQVAAGA